MTGPAEPAKYPTSLLRFNRIITSRAFTYIAAGLFVFDAIPRLVDGRVLRGLGNLAAAVLVVSMRARTRRAALGEIERRANAERRAEWGIAHPILSALALGVGWGGFMSVFFILTQEGSIAVALATGFGTGVLLFGPATVLLARRFRRT